VDRQATRKQRSDARPEPATRHAPAKRAPLPATRPELLALHRELRQRRDAAPLDSRERADAMEAIARVEVEVARRERAMEPPRV
jgi:hypothetical protein